jgi:hypothetical protein
MACGSCREAGSGGGPFDLGARLGHGSIGAPKRTGYGTFTNVPVSGYVSGMPDGRLRMAPYEAGLRLDDPARHVVWMPRRRSVGSRRGGCRIRPIGLRPRGWSGGGVRAVARAGEWPSRPGGQCGELLEVYPVRDAVPADSWYALMESARRHIDVLVYAGLFLPDGVLISRRCCAARPRMVCGCGCSLVIPSCEAVALRGSRGRNRRGYGGAYPVDAELPVVVFDAPRVQVRSTSSQTTSQRPEQRSAASSGCLGRTAAGTTRRPDAR